MGECEGSGDRRGGARDAHRGVGGGVVIYGVRTGRVRYLAVVSRRQAARPGALAQRLRALGLR